MRDYPSAGLIWGLENDRRTVTLSFPTTRPIQLLFDVKTFEHLIKQLGVFRLMMEPEPLAEWKLGEEFGAISNPGWATEIDVTEQHTILHLRDPRFGWLHYVLPTESAQPLVEEISAQLERRSLDRKKTRHRRVFENLVTKRMLERAERRLRRNLSEPD